MRLNFSWDLSGNTVIPWGWNRAQNMGSLPKVFELKYYWNRNNRSREKSNWLLASVCNFWNIAWTKVILKLLAKLNMYIKTGSFVSVKIKYTRQICFHHIELGYNSRFWLPLAMSLNSFHVKFPIYDLQLKPRAYF